MTYKYCRPSRFWIQRPGLVQKWDKGPVHHQMGCSTQHRRRCARYTHLENLEKFPGDLGMGGKSAHLTDAKQLTPSEDELRLFY